MAAGLNVQEDADCRVNDQVLAPRTADSYNTLEKIFLELVAHLRLRSHVQLSPVIPSFIVSWLMRSTSTYCDLSLGLKTRTVSTTRAFSVHRWGLSCFEVALFVN